MEIIVGIIIAVLILTILAITGINFEKKNFNNGTCPICNKKLTLFDTDSHGERGYKCKNCGYETWVSYNCVDGYNIFNEPIEIVNEDGTSIDDFPENPLKEKWDKLYPPTRNGKPCSNILGYSDDGTPIMNYTCIFCTELCQHSDKWKVPEEDKEEWDKYMEEIKEYNRIHNPKLFNINYKGENKNECKNN